MTAHIRALAKAGPRVWLGEQAGVGDIRETLGLCFLVQLQVSLKGNEKQTTHIGEPPSRKEQNERFDVVSLKTKVTQP